MELAEGQILDGKYQIEHVLGRGGMALVFSALHLQLDERVALKVLLPEALGSPEIVARFAREARAAVKIKSEHVVRVSDVGTLQSGAPFMVMEMLRGSDLAALAQKSGPFDVATAVDYVLQACEALAEAHALGIIHRDLKPANLFLTHRADGSPCIKVLDFGISKLTSTTASGVDLSMTRTHAIMGSPLYMSPEQMEDTRSVDARADVWAMGTIMYELLTGRVPFDADTVPRLCGLILRDDPAPPRDHRPDLPEGLERAILKCLEKDKNQRFQNVAELAVALAPYGPALSAQSVHRISRVLGTSGLALTQREGPEPGGATAHANPTAPTGLSWGRTLPRTRGRAVWLLVATVVVGAAVAALLWWRSQPPPEARAVPPPGASAAGSSKPHPPESLATAAAGLPVSARSSAEPSVLPAASPSGSATATAATASVVQPSRPAPVGQSVPVAAPSRPTHAAPSKASRTPAGAPAASSAAKAVDPLLGRH